MHLTTEIEWVVKNQWLRSMIPHGKNTENLNGLQIQKKRSDSSDFFE
jgi:hypothetical protein